MWNILEHGRGMTAEARRAPAEERQGEDRLCGRMLGLLLRGVVVREWDHFFASEVGRVGFWWGKVGLDVFIFRPRGVARKWSRSGPECAPEGDSASAGGGVGAILGCADRVDGLGAVGGGGLELDE
jgi:hypothetical protein